VTSARFDPAQQPLSGAYAVEASAGTGKTYSITLLWLRLLLEQRLRIDQILVTTFTTAATAELQERLLASLRRAQQAAQHGGDPEAPEQAIIARVRADDPGRDLERELAQAVSAFDLAPIVTMHGFCQGLISRHLLEMAADPDAELIEDARPLIEAAATDELFRRARVEAPAVQEALAASRTVAGNPLARLLPPADDAAFDQARAECCREMLDLLAQATGITATVRGNIAAKLRQGEPPGGSQLKALGAQAPAFKERIQRLKLLDGAQARRAVHAVAAEVARSLPQRLRAARQRTFDDILLQVHRHLDAAGTAPLAGAVRARFAAAIIDECQDTDSVQLDILQRIFLRPVAGGGFATQEGIRSFIVIGDPKQSIYRFRGADLGSYRRLASGLQQAPSMAVNYRSDRPLVEALNRLYGRRPEFRDAEAQQALRHVQVEAKAPGARIADPGSTLPLRVLWSPADRRPSAKHDLARRTAAEFRRLLAGGVTIEDRASHAPRPLTAGDLAVLAASHQDLRLMRQALIEVGIPCQMAGRSQGSIWGSAEAADALAWLAALEALERRTDPLSALLAFAGTPLGGLQARAILQLAGDPAAQAVWLRGLQDELDALRQIGPLPLLLRRIADPAPGAAHLRFRDGERRLTNWRHVGELLQRAWTRGLRRSAALRRWLARALAGQVDDADEDGGDLMRLETDLPAVQLATIHAAKGLEYPVVACPFLWSVRSLQRRQGAPIALVRRPAGAILDICSAGFPQHLAEAVRQEDEEQERLLYVALTRARHRLLLGLAPVADGGPTHCNGARHAAVAALFGLEAAPAQDWPGLLREWMDEPDEPGANGLDPLAPAPAPAVPLAPPPPLPRTAWPIQRCASYSGLSASAPEGDEPGARDHDGGTLPARGVAGLFDGLGGGAAFGDRVHAVLEDVLGNRRPLADAVGAEQAGFAQAIGTILGTPVVLGDGPGVALQELCGPVIAEMHFLLPVRRIAAADLARALGADPALAADPEDRSWAASLARWGFAALHGYLQGYIDLVFAHDGRWFIADYKTNLLPGYAAADLSAAMRDHDYLLQAWIYALALHRHLQRHLPDYRFDRHFGGCAYLFLRGFPDGGVWFRRPSLESLEALGRLLEPAEGAP